MRAGPLRSAPLAGLGSAHHAVHAGPCRVIRVASAWRKKLPTHRCGSAYPNCAICSPRCYGAGGTALSTCCIGPSGEDDINSDLCTATIESADRLCPHSIYNCSIRLERRAGACAVSSATIASAMAKQSRRDFLKTASAVTLTATASSSLAAGSRQRVFIGSNTPDGILAYDWDPATAE